MKKILTLFLAAGLAATLTCDLAMAQGRGKKGHRGGQLFARFDKNKDGKLTKSEVPAKLWARLVKADANKDGAVTKAELKAAHKGRRGHRKHKRKKGV